MKKEISVVGLNGEFKGTIEIKENFGKETVKFHNRGTHEEETKTVSTHKVVAIVDGQEVPAISSVVFMGKDNILFHADAVERALRNYLQNQADSKYKDPNAELKRRGFK